MNTLARAEAHAGATEGGTPYRLTTRTFLEDPFPTFARLREHDPVHWSDELRGWVLTRYDDVKAAMEMSVDFIKPFVVQHQLRNGDNGDVADLGRLVGGWMSFFDVPAHTRLRSQLNTVVNRQTVEAILPRISDLTDQLLCEIDGVRCVDLAKQFANRLPVLVIGELMGITSARDCLKLMEWSDAVHLFVGQAVRAENKYAEAAEGAREMDTFFRREIARRREQPRNDGITRMIRAGGEHESLNDAELSSNCAMLFYAGHETTAGLLSLAMLALSKRKDQLRRLREAPARMTAACEEFFRYDGPVQAMLRVADKDIVLRGRLLRKGDRIYPFINAANRDPRIFAQPDDLDIERRDNRHIVFGHGVHFCIGSWLARAEIPIALTKLLAKASDLELTGKTVEMRDSIAFRAPERLPMEIQWNR